MVMEHDPFGQVKCPSCDLIICVHEDAWHVLGEDELNENFGAMEEFVYMHSMSEWESPE